MRQLCGGYTVSMHLSEAYVQQLPMLTLLVIFVQGMLAALLAMAQTRGG